MGNAIGDARIVMIGEQDHGDAIPGSANFAFVDLKKFTTATPGAGSAFFIKGQHHYGSLKAPWYKIYDGVFFIRNMYPCTSIIKNQLEYSRH